VTQKEKFKTQKFSHFIHSAILIGPESIDVGGFQAMKKKFKTQKFSHFNSLSYFDWFESIDVGGFQAMAMVSGLPELKTTQFLRFVSFKNM